MKLRPLPWAHQQRSRSDWHLLYAPDIPRRETVFSPFMPVVNVFIMASAARRAACHAVPRRNDSFTWRGGRGRNSSNAACTAEGTQIANASSSSARVT